MNFSAPLRDLLYFFAKQMYFSASLRLCVDKCIFCEAKVFLCVSAPLRGVLYFLRSKCISLRLCASSWTIVIFAKQMYFSAPRRGLLYFFASNKLLRERSLHFADPVLEFFCRQVVPVKAIHNNGKAKRSKPYGECNDHRVIDDSLHGHP